MFKKGKETEKKRQGGKIYTKRGEKGGFNTQFEKYPMKKNNGKVLKSGVKSPLFPPFV